MTLQDIDAAFEIPIDLVERANHRKLTAEDVRAIRASKRSINALARRFHVEPRAVQLARRGDTVRTAGARPCGIGFLSPSFTTTMTSTSTPPLPPTNG